MRVRAAWSATRQAPHKEWPRLSNQPVGRKSWKEKELGVLIAHEPPPKTPDPFSCQTGCILFSIIRSVFSPFPCALAVDFSGPVVTILDSDTIEVLNGHQAEPICLSGIDCPEKAK